MGGKLDTNRDIAEAILDEVIAEGVTKPYVHDWTEPSDCGTHPDEWTGAAENAFGEIDRPHSA